MSDSQYIFHKGRYEIDKKGSINYYGLITNDAKPNEDNNRKNNNIYKVFLEAMREAEGKLEIIEDEKNKKKKFKRKKWKINSDSVKMEAFLKEFLTIFSKELNGDKVFNYSTDIISMEYKNSQFNINFPMKEMKDVNNLFKLDRVLNEYLNIVNINKSSQYIRISYEKKLAKKNGEEGKGEEKNIFTELLKSNIDLTNLT